MLCSAYGISGVLGEIIREYVKGNKLFLPQLRDDLVSSTPCFLGVVGKLSSRFLSQLQIIPYNCIEPRKEKGVTNFPQIHSKKESLTYDSDMGKLLLLPFTLSKPEVR